MHVVYPTIFKNLVYLSSLLHTRFAPNTSNMTSYLGTVLTQPSCSSYYTLPLRLNRYYGRNHYLFDTIKMTILSVLQYGKNWSSPN